MESMWPFALGEEVWPYTITGEPFVGKRFLFYPALGPEGEVLLKTLCLPPMRKAEDLARFNREIAVLRRLSHPGIMNIYRMGHKGASPWAAIPFLKGPTLAQLIDKWGCSIRQKVEIFREVVRAVVHSHKESIIHKELTPEKIRLTSSEPPWQPKILGFCGAVLGRAEAQSQAVGIDLLALGVILYQFLTGVIPFEENTDQEKNLKPESRVSDIEPVESINPEVDPYLAGICRKALIGEYKNVSDMATELDDWEEGNRRRLVEISRQKKETGDWIGAAQLLRQALDLVPWDKESSKSLEDIWVRQFGKHVRIHITDQMPQEALQAMSLKDHPNIVPVLAVEGGKTPYLVLGVPGGPTLRQRLRQSPLNTEECIEVARGVASALEASQKAGVLLRALGPTRIHMGDRIQVSGLGWAVGKPLNPVKALGKLIRELMVAGGGIPKAFQSPLAKARGPKPQETLQVFMNELEESYAISLPPEERRKTRAMRVFKPEDAKPSLEGIEGHREAILAAFLKASMPFDAGSEALKKEVRKNINNDFIIELVSMDCGAGSLATSKITVPFRTGKRKVNLTWEYGHRHPSGPAFLDPLFKNMFLLRILRDVIEEGLGETKGSSLMASYLYRSLSQNLSDKDISLKDPGILNLLKTLTETLLNHDPLTNISILKDIQQYQSIFFKQRECQYPILTLLERFISRIKREGDPAASGFSDILSQFLSSKGDPVLLQKLQVMLDALITFHPLKKEEEPLANPKIFEKIIEAVKKDSNKLKETLDKILSPDIMRYYYLDQSVAFLPKEIDLTCSDGQIIWTIPIPREIKNKEGHKVMLSQPEGERLMKRLARLLEAIQYTLNFCGPINRFGDLIGEWLKSLWLENLQKHKTGNTEITIDLGRALLDSVAPTLEPEVRLWNRISGEIPCSKALEAWAWFCGIKDFSYDELEKENIDKIREMADLLKKFSTISVWHICRIIHPVIAAQIARALTCFSQDQDKILIPPAGSDQLESLSAFASVRIYEIYASILLSPEEIPLLRISLLTDILRIWESYFQEIVEMESKVDSSLSKTYHEYENVYQKYKEKEPNVDDLDLIALIQRLMVKEDKPYALQILDAVREVKGLSHISSPPRPDELRETVQEWERIKEEWKQSEQWLIQQVESWGEKLIAQTNLIVENMIQPTLQDFAGIGLKQALISIQKVLTFILSDFIEKTGIELSIPDKVNNETYELYNSLLEATYSLFGFPDLTQYKETLSSRGDFSKDEAEAIIEQIQERNLAIIEDKLKTGPSINPDYLARLEILKETIRPLILKFEGAASPFAVTKDVKSVSEDGKIPIFRGFLLIAEEALPLYMATAEFITHAMDLNQNQYKKRIAPFYLTDPDQVAKLRSRGGVFNEESVLCAIINFGEEYLGQKREGSGIKKFLQRRYGTPSSGAIVYYRGDIHKEVSVAATPYYFPPPFTYGSIYYNPQTYQLMIQHNIQREEPPAPWIPLVLGGLFSLDEKALSIQGNQITGLDKRFPNISPEISEGRSVANFWLSPNISHGNYYPEERYHLVQIEITNPINLFKKLSETKPRRTHKLAYLFIPVTFERWPETQAHLLIFFRHEIKGEGGLEEIRFYPVADPLPFAEGEKYLEYIHSTPGFFTHKQQIGFEQILKLYPQKLQAQGKYIAPFSQGSIFPIMQGHILDMLRSETQPARFLKLAKPANYSMWERFITPTEERALQGARASKAITPTAQIAVESRESIDQGEWITLTCACGRQTRVPNYDQGQVRACQGCSITWEIPAQDQRVGPLSPSYKPKLKHGFKWEGDIVICEKDGSPMVLVPAGVFLRGSDTGEPNERPEHTIYIDTYIIDVFPVTNSRFNKFIQEGGYSLKDYWSDEGWAWKEHHNIQYPLFWGHTSWNHPDQPVVGVSWYEAEAYCVWAGKTLVTEASWEKAARGGTWLDGYKGHKIKNLDPGRLWPWGNEPPTRALANYKETGPKLPTPVGRYPKGASPYGCLEMAGNVRQWCKDTYDENFYHTSPSKNPVCHKKEGKERLWVQRGGSFYDSEDQIKTTSRLWGTESRYDYVGFRGLCSIE